LVFRDSAGEILNRCSFCCDFETFAFENEAEEAVAYGWALTDHDAEISITQ
jgi:hypothetical protein